MRFDSSLLASAIVRVGRHACTEPLRPAVVLRPGSRHTVLEMSSDEPKSKKKKRSSDAPADADAAASDDAPAPAKKPARPTSAVPLQAARSAPAVAPLRAAAGPAGPTTHSADEFEAFIKFLPYETTEEELGTFFSRYGELSRPAVLLKDFATGRCKGVGWVAFSAESSLKRAVAATGVAFGGRHLDITVATKKQGAGIKGTAQEPGTHTPALLAEVLRDLVRPDPDGTFVDATFGRGGHTRAMLARLSPKGRLHAFDMDPAAIAVGRELEAQDKRFKIHHRPFSTMAEARCGLGRERGIACEFCVAAMQCAERCVRSEVRCLHKMQAQFASSLPVLSLLIPNSAKHASGPPSPLATFTRTGSRGGLDHRDPV